MSFVNHSSILKSKFKKLNDQVALKKRQAAPDKRQSIDTYYLEQIQSKFSESEQKYLLELARRNKWKLPVRGIIENYSKNNILFSDMLKVLQTQKTLELPTESQVSSHNLYSDSVKTELNEKNRRNFSIPVVHSKFGHKVYFVHQVENPIDDNPFTNRNSQRHIPTESFDMHANRLNRVRHYANRVKKYFKPSLNEKQQLDFQLRNSSLPSLKRFMEMPRLKLFK